jgi:phosphate transport system substrate-binding protein
MKQRTVISCLAAAAMLAAVPASASAVTIKTGGSTGLQLLAQKLANAYKIQHGIKVTVAGGGSGAGIKGAASGKFDIGDSSRDPAATDAKGLVFTPVTREPFVVIVNPKNPLKSLTKAQIKAIFTGRITRWSQVGWRAGGAIKLYSRVGTSGTLATFQKLYLDKQKVSSSAVQLASNGLDRASVARNSHGVSFVAFSYTVGVKNVRALKVGGIAGTLKNVLNGSFKFWGYQYFVTKGSPRGAVKTYISWVRSAKGAAVIKRFALPTRDPAKRT